MGMWIEKHQLKTFSSNNKNNVKNWSSNKVKITSVFFPPFIVNNLSTYFERTDIAQAKKIRLTIHHLCSPTKVSWLACKLSKYWPYNLTSEVLGETICKIYGICNSYKVNISFTGIKGHWNFTFNSKI